MDAALMLAPERPLLARLEDRLRDEPAPTALPAGRFEAAHGYFEAASDQQAGIRAWLEHALSAPGKGGGHLRVLSVGCGSGMLDLPLIQALSRCWRTVHYTGVDPSEPACRRFRERFDAARLSNVQLELMQVGIDELSPRARWDAVVAVHSLYYVPDPAATLEILPGHLAPGGRLIVMKAPMDALNALADRFWRGPEDGRVWFSERLESHLDSRGIAFRKHRIDARVDVTPCFDEGSEEGSLLLDFITQCDSASFTGGTAALCREYLAAAAVEDDGRHRVAHPVDVFVLDVAPAPGTGQAP